MLHRKFFARLSGQAGINESQLLEKHSQVEDRYAFTQWTRLTHHFDITLLATQGKIVSSKCLDPQFDFNLSTINHDVYHNLFLLTLTEKDNIGLHLQFVIFCLFHIIYNLWLKTTLHKQPYCIVKGFAIYHNMIL